ncbi:hypothetical protein [Chryseobacterium indologenes]|uniref:Uncharacterized protein n=1 Tax=Chryseobacterium indologenes TaxID=253 RepID=A0A0N1A093_CHRID|nr:hypothetical protein [Chryseobacterium indologenes]KPE53137.1 hypothetical protein AOB46_03900 [Chryseobacterium indologenes]
MKIFSFNTFFGLEQELTEHPETVIFAAMFLPLTVAVLLIPIAWIFRKLKLNMYLIQALYYSLIFTFILGAIAIFVLFLTTDRNGVKLAYCWLAIFIGMLTFSIVNTSTLNKMFTDWGKIIKAKK